MTENLSTMSLPELLQFPFRQEDWQSRFILGAGLVLLSFMIPILPLFPLYGYAMLIMKQSIAGEEAQLPEWGDFGRLLGDGLRFFLASALYLLPGILVFILSFGIYLIASFLLPLATMDPDPSFEAVMIIPFLFVLSMVVLFVGMFLGTALMVLGAIPMPMALARIAEEDSFAAGFQFREILRLIRADGFGYFAGWVVTAGLGSVIYLVIMLAYTTLILCGLIPFLAAPMAFYTTVVYSALFGGIYRSSKAKLKAS